MTPHGNPYHKVTIRLPKEQLLRLKALHPNTGYNATIRMIIGYYLRRVDEIAKQEGEKDAESLGELRDLPEVSSGTIHNGPEGTDQGRAAEDSRRDP